MLTLAGSLTKGLNASAASTLIALSSFSGSVDAHCRPWHPGHCLDSAADALEDVGDWLYGGVKKRAKMIISDPLGTALDPIKVIDESIPSPMSFVEYVVTNPDEIIEILENPVAATVGLPVAMAIADGRNSALKHGTKPLPKDVRAKLQVYFDDDLLDSVRYAANPGLFNGVLQAVALHGFGAAAITLINVVVFKEESSTYDINIWAHELRHVKQYRDMGLTDFAATYTLDYGAIERPAYRFQTYFGKVRRSNVITSELFIGLGGKCLSRSSNSIGAQLHLGVCIPNNSLQRWGLSRNAELRVDGTNVCVDASGSPENRTRPRLRQCTGQKQQQFVFTKRGELRSRVRDGFCLETAGGVIADGNPIQMYDCNRSGSQLWMNPTVKLVSIPAAPDLNRCLRASGRQFGSPVGLAGCSKNDVLQAWASENHGGKLRLIAVPDACLQVRELSQVAGASLEISRCTDEGNQEFEVTMNQEIRTDVSSNRCLQLGETRTVVTAGCDNSRSQQWD